MPNRRRFFVPGISLHVRQRGNNRCAIFGDDRDYQLFLAMLRTATQRFAVDVHGFTLMTTHTHLLVTPNTRDSVGRAMQALGDRYVPYFNRKYQRVGTLWTGRYLAKPINDERYWLTCLRYIEQNPVRARLVIEPGQYKWSSYGVHASGQPSEWLASHRVLDALGSNSAERQRAYKALCATSLTDEQIVTEQIA